MVTYISPSYLALGSLTLTGLEDSGVEWITETVEGWEGSPRSTVSVVQKARAGGAWAGTAYFAARSLVASGVITAPTEALLSYAIDRLNDACSLGDS